MMNFFPRAAISPEPFGIHIQALFGALTLVGLILLTYWAIRYLNKEHLRAVAIWILAVGLIGSILCTWLANSFRWGRPHMGFLGPRESVSSPTDKGAVRPGQPVLKRGALSSAAQSAKRL
jgi:hypothetical protein